MRIGLIGLGRIGELHARNLAAMPDIELVLADVEASRAETLAAELGCTFSAPDDVFTEAERVEAVAIASSTDSHAPLLRAAMSAGIPAFCEKPVAKSLEESIEISRLERDTNAYVHIGFQRRFDAAYRTVQQAVADQSIGRLHSLRAMTLDNAPPPEAYIRVSGGIFADCCIHDFDIIRFVSGREVVSAYAHGANGGPAYIKDAGDSDTVAGVLVLDDGTPVTFGATRVNGYGHDVRLDVHGTTGDLSVGLMETMPLRSAEPGVDFPTGAPVQGFIDRFLPAYDVELRSFVAAVGELRGGGSVQSPCTAYDGLQAMRIAVACTRSRDTGQPVALTEVPQL